MFIKMVVFVVLTHKWMSVPQTQAPVSEALFQINVIRAVCHGLQANEEHDE